MESQGGGSQGSGISNMQATSAARLADDPAVSSEMDAHREIVKSFRLEARTAIPTDSTRSRPIARSLVGWEMVVRREPHFTPRGCL